jgi:hypothetical protein
LVLIQQSQQMPTRALSSVKDDFSRDRSVS